MASSAPCAAPTSAPCASRTVWARSAKAACPPPLHHYDMAQPHPQAVPCRCSIMLQPSQNRCRAEKSSRSASYSSRDEHSSSRHPTTASPAHRGFPTRTKATRRHPAAPALFSGKMPSHEKKFPTLENNFSRHEKIFSSVGKKFSSIAVFSEN